MEIDLGGWTHEDLKKKLNKMNFIEKVTLYKEKKEEINVAGLEYIHTDVSLDKKRQYLSELYDTLEAERIIISLSITEHMIN